MNRFARQLSAAQRQYDSLSPDEFDEARDEFIAERSAEILAQRRADPDAMRAAISEVQSNDYDDLIALDLANFVVAVDATDDESRIAAAAVRLWRELVGRVEADLKAGAENDAASEFDALHQPPDDDEDDARQAA